MDEQLYTVEELMKLVVRVDHVLNSRPLQPLSNDTNDLEALTPGHFLIGQLLLAIPENNFINVATNRLRHWQLIHQVLQSFWRHWGNEYLRTL